MQERSFTYQLALQWLQAFNDHDLEKLLALYDDQAEHYSPKLAVRRPETRGMVKGKEALRDWWQDAFKRLPGLTYREKKITADESSVFMEYIRSVPGESDMNVAEVLDISEGKIIASRVYHG